MKKKRDYSTIILIVILIAGLSLLLYPSVSDFWNARHQTRVIGNYAASVAGMDDQEYEERLSKAEEYNRKLAKKGNHYTLTEEELTEYESLLDVSGDGMMGYIEIPSIHCTLPIYHGTEEKVLQVGAGHIPGSALPVGGSGTHCVLSGHRGLPSSKLFTDLDMLIEGDVFTLTVLKETFTYEVDQIRIVEPDDLSELDNEPGQDYCTLVTCTPYGINTQRLLVRGHRIDNLSDSLRITADAIQIETIVVAPFAAIPILLILFLWLMISTRKKKSRGKDGKKG
jgi:sortase A